VAVTRYKPFGKVEISKLPLFSTLCFLSSRPTRSVIRTLSVEVSVGMFRVMDWVAGLGEMVRGWDWGALVGVDSGESFTIQASVFPNTPDTSPSFDQDSPAMM